MMPPRALIGTMTMSRPVASDSGVAVGAKRAAKIVKRSRTSLLFSSKRCSRSSSPTRGGGASVRGSHCAQSAAATHGEVVERFSMRFSTSCSVTKDENAADLPGVRPLAGMLAGSAGSSRVQYQTPLK